MVYALPSICPGKWDTHSYNKQQEEENLKNCGLCCAGSSESKTERKWKNG